MQIRQVRMQFSCHCQFKLCLAGIQNFKVFRDASTATHYASLKYKTLFRALMLHLESEQFPMHPRTRNRLWQDMQQQQANASSPINNSLFLTHSFLFLLVLQSPLTLFSFFFFSFSFTFSSLCLIMARQESLEDEPWLIVEPDPGNKINKRSDRDSPSLLQVPCRNCAPTWVSKAFKWNRYAL